MDLEAKCTNALMKTLEYITMSTNLEKGIY
jgi:hypothetical protein